MKNILILALSVMSICPINASNVDDGTLEHRGLNNLSQEIYVLPIHDRKNKIRVEVSKNGNVEDLKNALLRNNSEFVAIEYITLLWLGRPLDNDELLSGYDTQKIGPIILVITK